MNKQEGLFILFKRFREIFSYCDYEFKQKCDTMRLRLFSVYTYVGYVILEEHLRVKSTSKIQLFFGFSPIKLIRGVQGERDIDVHYRP
jgi:hypothetical protein